MAAIGLVQMLIEAAEYLDRREREAEHGYASMPPFISSRERESLKRKSKSKKNTSSSLGTEEQKLLHYIDGESSPTLLTNAQCSYRIL